MSGPNYVQQVIDPLTVELRAIDPDPDPVLTRLYALLVLVKGVDTTLQDVHDAWSIYKDITRPDHRSLIPFNDLTPEVRELDRKYVDAVHRIAKAA